MLRLVSAVVLLAVLVLTIWVLPAWATLVLAAAAAAAAARELAVFARSAGSDAPPAFVAVAAAVLTLAFASTTGAFGTPIPAGAVVLALIVVAGCVALTRHRPAPLALNSAALMIMAPLYIGGPLGAIVWVHAALGPRGTTWLIATIALSDSAQYYTGRALGRRRLAPAISPAKTVEGALGGLAAAAVAGLFLGPWTLPSIAPMAGLGVAVLIAGAGIGGDLFESLLKRSAGVKDSGTSIPGHGGVLDRIDSHLFAAPVFLILLLRYLA